MSVIKTLEKLYWSSVGCFFMMSAMILIMPVIESNEKAIIPIGLAFWFFAISGYILLIVANVEFKRISGNLRKNKRSLPGIISFFSNKIAMIADVAVIISIVAFVIICITELRFKYIAFVTLFLLIFSLHMHCLFNGRIYKLIKNEKERY